MREFLDEFSLPYLGVLAEHLAAELRRRGTSADMYVVVVGAAIALAYDPSTLASLPRWALC